MALLPTLSLFCFKADSDNINTENADLLWISGRLQLSEMAEFEA